MQSLLNKKIVLGISGGIAAYKTPELARLLIQEGASVQVVMTEAAQQFVTSVTMQALTGNPVFTSQWDNSISNNMAHIELSRSADIILIAPTSADLMAKLSLGLADDLLSTLCLARDCPLLIAPAMNKQMWEHAATQRSADRLHHDGVTLLGPASGFQACGEVGMGRMLEPAEISEQVIAFFQKKSLVGKKVLITAGPTFEAIDPVRGITNHSSGKMGFAIARAALEAGAQVRLIAGPCDLPTPLEATGKIIRTNVVSAKEMHAATLAATDCDVFFAVAAVADWGIAKPAKEKIKRQGDGAPNMEFVANPDILLDVAKTVKTKNGKPSPYCVGFAAESTDLEKHADEKLKRKGIPMIVGNIGPDTFGSDFNQLLVMDASGSKKIAKAEKLHLARQLIQLVAKKI
ncbi:bifunctional phosphopantothenoylcysteine decarboxylase/phosphopantothenate--cysteine ligase CoaBC [Polynucleobacter sp. es-GGE-1]|jgi:phosphopantothenoylcysteine decarboxylase/phosphopantothenate--cysteine ligase|uniref:bifunctional phosphopantothenoylcysteine decarboxylase/phosphopantothenate--cysteine ligase CoaBC n=1 Tax=unclassified Polynucleobacter TaxID=2640945 RepID=UPI001BFE4FAB|nr:MULTISPECIES: bifunctional phosphopantothenoylcysteine decarboxylase/phosphopantothenate--cysteine ligase CoaBC [unclassified Polynucleobacter]MBU3634705.1 bifunctional phosphopantothenoylcysteine decarboxylase/phosphopantothenate--cysteine ligase CoaBC [Polynucleobacter sp. es-GGE-1]MEA9600243.1 bifunctional phosphopantothenoylcysteine decarboxylase/phosphopantothenate--cysteine ligase CoaBC [Polynucleobacter sp. AP-Sanab-80-C2]QWE06305.1 bifunctional phosphopantothenoylcysteine decarboxylas